MFIITENYFFVKLLKTCHKKVSMLKIQKQYIFEEQNMAEMIDVLNENGVKTGEAITRAEIHKKGLWHRATIVCIVNSDNEILLQRRSESREKHSGLWDLSVASHVQAGGDSVSTAVREINEEIGVQIEYRAQVKDFRFLTSFRNKQTIGDFIENQFYDLFVIRRDIAIEDLNYNDDEVMDAKWVNYTGLQKLIKEGVLHPRLEWVDEVVNYINKF